MNEDDSIRLSRSTLTVLVVTLVLSLMAVAFLLGRQSAPVAPSAPQVAEVPPATLPLRSEEPPARRELPTRPLPPPAAPSAPSAAEPVAAPAAPVAAPAPEPVAPAPERRPVPAVPAPSAPERRRAPEPPGQSAEVRQYLAAVEGVTAATEQLGDPNEFATTLLNEAMLGETTGIDGLLAQVEAARKKLAGIQPPPNCREHHKLMKEQLASSQGLLQKFKRAIVSGDTGALTALAGQGRTLQAQAERLKKLTENLQN